MKILTIILFVLIVISGLLLHDASTIAIDHIDWLVMFDNRHDARIEEEDL